MAASPTPSGSLSLLDRWADIAALGTASAVLGWDQETYMPRKGQPGRGRVLAGLAGLIHEKLTDPALSEAIDAAAVTVEPGSMEEAQVREARRAVAQATAVPAQLARALAEATSRGQHAWQQARAEDDFSLFAGELDEIIRLTSEKADAYVAAGLAEWRYDALLDEYEPGATERQLSPLLESLRAELAPLVKAAADSGTVIDESPCRGDFPLDDQRSFVEEVARAIGYDFEAGRLDGSAHPFTTGFGPLDVRITWRGAPDDFRMGLFGVVHETGHALYEQGLPAELAGTPAGGAVSLGVHESQSRLWENLVGRSRAFWQWAAPRFEATFPGAGPVDRDRLWPALHTVRPSLIRVEADEATYNLHVVARFEIERALFGGELSVHDLPALWDDTYDELLGIRPTGVADGVLQDIHWSMGAFGYFPTYTLGNLLSAQLFEAARHSIGDLDGDLARGDFAPLLGFLRERVHRHASRYPAPELIERATGAPLSSEPFLRYLTSTVREVYGVTA